MWTLACSFFPYLLDRGEGNRDLGVLGAHEQGGLVDPVSREVNLGQTDVKAAFVAHSFLWIRDKWERERVEKGRREGHVSTD